jgi:hypothetical protein
MLARSSRSFSVRRRRRHLHAGKVDALPRGREPADDDLRPHAARHRIGRLDDQPDRPVVDQHERAGRHVVGERGVDHREDRSSVLLVRHRELRLARDEDHLMTGLELDPALRHQSEADLRTLQVPERPDDAADLITDLADESEPLAMVVDRAVREVEPEDVRARLDGGTEPDRVVECGSERRHDLCPAHDAMPPVVRAA